MSITSLAVFCGSKPGADAAFTNAAIELGALLALHNISLIYGGGKSGLMGAAANAALAAGGKVLGVMPRVLAERERQHNALTELFVVETIHERKRRMYELCEAAIILPGGFGTLDELFEILTWNGLTLHNKQVFLLNTGGFYNHLLMHLQTMQAAGFLYAGVNEALTVLSSVAGLKRHLFQKPTL